jgi:O-antigen biosynthesis protein WbqV
LGAPRNIRGRPVLGAAIDLESAVDVLQVGGISVTAVLLSRAYLREAVHAPEVKTIARRLGLTLLTLETIGLGQRSEIRFEDFLFRKKRVIDDAVIDQGVRDKTLLITGGGGSIGGDIALRAATHGARKIVLADSSELGLQTRLAQLRKDHPHCLSSAFLCDVRDAADLSKLVGRHEPDIMVHAAALKHVDLVEENWRAAVLTNVLGTLNALDAADSHEVRVFINISSDKARWRVSHCPT